jgi:hypothetical protein
MKYIANKSDVFAFSTKGGFKSWNWEPILGEQILVTAEIRGGMEAEWATISTPA